MAMDVASPRFWASPFGDHGRGSIKQEDPLGDEVDVVDYLVLGGNTPRILGMETSGSGAQRTSEGCHDLLRNDFHDRHCGPGTSFQPSATWAQGNSMSTGFSSDLAEEPLVKRPSTLTDTTRTSSGSLDESPQQARSPTPPQPTRKPPPRAAKRGKARRKGRSSKLSVKSKSKAGVQKQQTAPPVPKASWFTGVFGHYGSFSEPLAPALQTHAASAASLRCLNQRILELENISTLSQSASEC